MSEAMLSEILERARAGDSAAFAELYRQFYRRVFALCRHLLASPTQAEDAASEVFVRLQAAMKSYDCSLPFPQWLLGIASNYCVDLLRRRRVEGQLFDAGEIERLEHGAALPSPLEQVLTTEHREALQAAITALPVRYRVPLVMRYYDDLSYEQIATTLNLSRSHVAILIFRAKKELRRLILTNRKTRLL